MKRAAGKIHPEHFDDCCCMDCAADRYRRDASHLNTQEPTTDWPSIQEQEAYWEQRDKDLDKIESACAWFDEKDRRLPF